MKIVRKNKILFSIIAMISILILGGLTAFAYEPPYKITGSHNDNVSFEYNLEAENEVIEPIFYDQYLIDENGIIYEIKDLDSSGRIDCVHNYVDSNMILTNHIKNNNGGCTTTKYTTKKCIICGSVIEVDKISTTTYEKCPH